MWLQFFFVLGFVPTSNKQVEKEGEDPSFLLRIKAPYQALNEAFLWGHPPQYALPEVFQVWLLDIPNHLSGSI